MATKQIQQPKKRSSFKTDMPLWMLAGLALLAMPRAVIHDLDGLPFDSPAYIAMAVAPLLLYLAIAIFRNNKRPMYDFIVLGLFFGVFLSLVHLILWDHKWGGNPPAFGDQLTGVFCPEVEDMLFRISVTFSGLHVGIALGALFGAIGLIAQKVRARRV